MTLVSQELAQKDSAWEGLDEAAVASVANLLLGYGGLTELVQRGWNDKDQGHASTLSIEDRLFGP